MYDKLTDKQKEKLANLCEDINNIFLEENELSEKDIDDYYNSYLYKGIFDAMEHLGRWC